MIWYVPAIGGFLLASIIAYTAHSLDVDRLELKAEKDKQAQVQYDVKQCQEAKDLTAKSEQDYESQIAKRDADIAALKLRYGTCAIMPVAKPARVSHAANQPNKPSKSDGILISSLLDYAGECEKDRIKVVTLQGFITSERK